MTQDHDKTKEELIAELTSLRSRLRDHDEANSGSHRLRELLDGLPQMVYECDREGWLTYLNRYALDRFKTTPEELRKGVHTSALLHPSYHATAQRNLQDIMDGSSTQGEEYVGVATDGTNFPFRTYSQAIRQDGEVVGVRGILIDVSKLTKDEVHYRTLFENTGTATCIFGDDGIISTCNSQFESLAGYTKKEIEGRLKWSDFVDPIDLERMGAYHRKRTDETSGAPSDYEFTFLARNGLRKLVHVFVKLIPGTKERVTSLIDLSERVQAEQRLRLSEERYALVARGANDGIWDWDLATDQVYFSPRYKAILGYEDDEFPNKADSWKNHVHPDDLERVFKANLDCIEGKIPLFQVEYRMRHKDGSYRWILGRGASEKDSTGKVYRLAGTHTDLTEYKLVEARYRELVENASDGIYQCTPDGRFITANQAMARHLGYSSPEEMIGTISDIEAQHWFIPGKRLEFLRLLAEKGTLENYEIRLRKKDGSPIWVSENIRAIYDSNGQLDYYEGFLQDITERKMQEKTINALYAISKAITTTHNLEHLYENIHIILGKVIDATNFFIAMVDEERDVVGFPYFADEQDDYYEITNMSDPNNSSMTLHILRTGKPLLLSSADPAAVRFQKQVGVIGSQPAVWLGVPLQIKGKIIGVMAVQHYSNPHHYTVDDVTFMEAVSEQVALALERKTNEEELTTLNEELERKVEQRTAELQEQAAALEQANARLTELDRVKSGLVSSVSHELRTPLTSIRGFAKLTGKDFMRHFEPMVSNASLKKRAKRIVSNLEIIENEGERLTRLINDFLDINRIESGKASWNDTPTDPCEIARKAVSALSGAFAARPNVELITELPERLPLIHADPDKIQQVLINLLNNAFKFTKQGTVAVSMTEGRSELVVTVTDTGIGIMDEELPNIFEKFHRSREGDTILKDRGTGLGLAICKEIVTHYGGSIWVESTLGKGSTFTFTLPAAEDAATCS